MSGKKTNKDKDEEYMLGTSYYRIESIDGDYANLKLLGNESEELKLVARALLPEEICEE